MRSSRQAFPAPKDIPDDALVNVLMKEMTALFLLGGRFPCVAATPSSSIAPRASSARSQKPNAAMAYRKRNEEIGLGQSSFYARSYSDD
jgi:hypothetical protein